MEFITAASLESIGIVGICVLNVVGLARGWVVTKREADVYIKRAEKAEDANRELITQNGELMEMARLGQATFTALRAGVEQ